MEKNRIVRLFFTLGVAFGLVACIPAFVVEDEPTLVFTVTPTSLAPGSRDTPTPTSHDTPAPVSTPTSFCPEADMVYQLDYIHRVVQNMANVRFEHVAEPDAAFFLTIHQDGTIDSDDFENLVRVSITGTFDDCVLEGEAALSADIFGLCAEGIATVDITEHWEAVSTTVTCPGQKPQSTNIAGFFSAPQDQFDFELKEEGDTQVLGGIPGFCPSITVGPCARLGLRLCPCLRIDGRRWTEPRRLRSKLFGKPSSLSEQSEVSAVFSRVSRSSIATRCRAGKGSLAGSAASSIGDELRHRLAQHRSTSITHTILRRVGGKETRLCGQARGMTERTQYRKSCYELSGGESAVQRFTNCLSCF